MKTQAYVVLGERINSQSDSHYHTDLGYLKWNESSGPESSAEAQFSGHKAARFVVRDEIKTVPRESRSRRASSSSWR
jgi:hypothetical protein